MASEQTKETHVCEGENCTITETYHCINQWLDADDPDYETWLCGDHAIEAGFCLWCGYLGIGGEDYDFSGVKGYHRECLDEIRAETGEDDEFDDFTMDDWGWGDYPNSWYDGSSLAELEGDEPTHTYIGPGSETRQEGGSDA